MWQVYSFILLFTKLLIGRHKTQRMPSETVLAGGCESTHQCSWKCYIPGFHMGVLLICLQLKRGTEAVHCQENTVSLRGSISPKNTHWQVQLAAHFYSYQTKHCTFSQVTCLWRFFPLTSPMLSPEKNADGRCRKRQAKCSKIQIIAYMSFSNAWSHLKLKMYDSSCEWVNFAHNNAL